MDMSALEDIGLTNAEIKVYIALLEMGATKTGPIIEKSGLQSSVVYSALSKLLEKGLVSSVREGKITVYLASDPKNIIDYIDEKKSKLNEILPLLAAKQSLAKNRTDAVLFRGIRGVKELLLELLDAGGKEHHTMGSPLESTMLGSAWWLSYHKKRAAKGIKGKLLFNESLKEWAKKFGYHDRNTEIRFMA
ncbi:MAG TPA: helix-turn-helix domain-containing protein, partial [archaeon]|nr:helix-turn-helix domain-containing protein [archaeon]